VSASVRRLVQGRLVRALGVRAGRPGRPPISYIADGTAGFVVGADVGASNLRVAAADIYGEMIVEREQPIESGDPDAVGPQMVALVNRVSRTASATHGQFLGLGVSSAEPADADRPGLSGAADTGSSPEDPVVALLQQRFDVPMLVDQGFNLSAIGERWRGVAKGVANFVFISIGARVGMSIVLADELVRGAHNMAGGIARIPLGLQSSMQRAGAHPRFKHEVSNAKVLATLAHNAVDSAPERPGNVGAALEILEAEAELIGYAVATVCATIDPELVVLGGRIGSNPTLLQPVREAAASFLPIAARIETTILHGKAPMYGALALGLREARAQLFRRGDPEGAGNVDDD
jgi:predicted NBD/HSP70 family sugar kinase